MYDKDLVDGTTVLSILFILLVYSEMEIIFLTLLGVVWSVDKFGLSIDWKLTNDFTIIIELTVCYL